MREGKVMKAKVIGPRLEPLTAALRAKASVDGSHFTPVPPLHP